MLDKKVYKHIPSGAFLTLFKEYKDEVNAYIECDEKGAPIKRLRSWSSSPQEQTRIVIGKKDLLQINL
jgi:hypothetical protein